MALKATLILAMQWVLLQILIRTYLGKKRLKIDVPCAERPLITLIIIATCQQHQLLKLSRDVSRVDRNLEDVYIQTLGSSDYAKQCLRAIDY